MTQITDKGYVGCQRLAVNTKSLYDWIKRSGRRSDELVGLAAAVEIRRLEAEQRCVTEGYYILKKAAAFFAKNISELHLYKSAPHRIFRAGHVPSTWGA